jgi:hypothetical protein
MGHVCTDQIEKASRPMMIRQLIQGPFTWLSRPQPCVVFRSVFLVAAFLCLVGQALYDHQLATVVSIFPQWLLLGSIWYSWRQDSIARDYRIRGTVIFALLIPALSCLALFVAWVGWKANIMAIGGIIPVSDSASYYISAQTFLREGFLDASGQRRPIDIIVTSLWLYLSGDDFKLLLLIQALSFSVVAFLASAVTAAAHGFRAGLLLFAFLLVFAEPYLATTLSETNGIIFGILALVGFLFGISRRNLFAYASGAFFLAMGQAIRPSAMFVLPCVVIAGGLIFVTARIRRIAVLGALAGVILLPSAISVALNNTMSHGEGTLNSNLSYTVYGLVTGGRGWEQYEKDNPGTLDGLSEAERSRVIWQASRQQFEEHPLGLVRGVAKGLVLGPLQVFLQITRLAFLGAAGDPLRIIPAAAVVAVSLLFAGILSCQWLRRRHTIANGRDFRIFYVLFLMGYLASIPFFYADGGLRVHAAVLPVLSYMLVWLLLPPVAATENNLSGNFADGLLVAAGGVSIVLLGLLGLIVLVHPRSRNFAMIPVSASFGNREMTFRFDPGWPNCDLGNFERPRDGGRPHWFSGAIPDDGYRSAGIKEILGKGRLYFGFDTGARVWKIIHTDQPVGLLNKITVGPVARPGDRDYKYRDYYSVGMVQVMDPKSAHP